MDLFSNHSELIGYRRWVIALSGGVDSTVLLHSAKQYLTRLQQSSNNHNNIDETIKNSDQLLPELIALHVDHQLSPNHLNWVEHCQSLCDQLAVPLKVMTVNVDTAAKGGLEQSARKARYHAYQQLMDQHTLLLTGHHADDQAETLLMRLFRGSGIDGARGIPESRDFYEGKIFRPLLNSHQSEIEDYAKRYELSVVEDESNQDASLDRNYLRSSILPLIKQRWPQSIASMLRFTQLSAENEALNNDLAATDFNALLSNETRYGINLVVDQLLCLPPYRRKNIFRFWLKKHIDYMPDRRRLDELDALVENRRVASQIDIEHLSFYIHGGGLFCVDKHWLNALIADFQLDNMIRLDQNFDGFFKQGTSFQLRAYKNTGKAVLVGLKEGDYQIHFRQQGLSCRINGQTRPIKKVLQEAGIPCWLRNVYPIILSGEEVAAVGDYRVCDNFRDEGGWLLQCCYDLDREVNNLNI